MKFTKFLILGLLLTLRLPAITFNFVFDNDTAAGQQAMIGTGSFTFANDLGDGTHPFLSLGAYTMSFSFPGGLTFTEANINSILADVRVVLSTDALGRRLQFSDTGAGGGGPSGGSIDLSNATMRMTFEPSFFGNGLTLYQVLPNSSSTALYFGTYEARIPGVPDSASTLMLSGIGLAGLACASITRSSRRVRA